MQSPLSSKPLYLLILRRFCLTVHKLKMFLRRLLAPVSYVFHVKTFQAFEFCEDLLMLWFYVLMGCTWHAANHDATISDCAL